MKYTKEQRLDVGRRIYDGVDDAPIEGLDQNRDFFTLLLNNEDIKRSALGIFAIEVYTSLRAIVK